MRHTLVFLFYIFQINFLFGQVPINCPSFPQVNYLDSSCYMYLDEIKLGQATVGHKDLWGTEGREVDIFVPSNRPGWAISQVHAWQLLRNIIGYDVEDIHFYIATTLKESFTACDKDIEFDPALNLQYPLNEHDEFKTSVTNAMTIRDGCFQIDQNTGLPQFTMFYPHRYKGVADHENFMGGTNFETATLAKAYYALIQIRYFDFARGSGGLDLKDMFENTQDKFAGDKFLAAGYNRGFYADELKNPFLQANRDQYKAMPDWLQDDWFNYDYTRAISHGVKVLTTEGFKEGNNEWHSWYDNQITWDIMTDYMAKIFAMFPDAPAAEVTDSVKKAFDLADKDNNGSVSFRFEFGSVLDAFILNMPYDDPMATILTLNQSELGCSGCVGPYVKIKAERPLKACKGIGIKLETVKGSGYEYQWLKDGIEVDNPNDEKHIFYAKETGLYSVIVTNKEGCAIEADCPIQIEVEDCSTCNMTVEIEGTKASCSGSFDGSLKAIVTGVTGPFIYKWTGPVNGDTETLENVPDGAYILEVTKKDDPGCKGYANIYLGAVNPLHYKLTASSTSLSCQSAQLEAKAVANPPATCTYNLKITGPEYGNIQVNSIQVHLYENGTALGPFKPRANGNGNTVFLDEQVEIVNGAEICFAIFNSQTFDSSFGGNGFKIELTDPFGNVVMSYEPQGNYKPGVTEVFKGKSNCTTDIPVVTYKWTPEDGLDKSDIPNPIATINGNAIYTVTISGPDDAKCDIKAIVEVTGSGGDVDAGEDVTICKGGSVQLNGKGDGEFFWSPGDGLDNPDIANPVASPTKTTTYTLTVDGTECSGTDTVTVFVEEIKADAGEDVSICENGSTQLNVSGGENYSWSPTTGLSDPKIPNPIASPTETTIYTVTVTDASGSCTSTDEVEVMVGLIIANGGNDVTICEGGSAQMNASGGDVYSWSPATGLSATDINNPIATPDVTTTYTVRVSDASGQCVDTDEVTVTVGDIEADAGEDKTICPGSSVKLKASGGSKYSWSPTTGLSDPLISSPDASPSVTTTYVVTVSDHSGNCPSSTDDVTVFVIDVLADAGNDVKICPGGSVQLEATGGAIYTWSPEEGLSDPNIPNPIATPTETIVYTVTVTDESGRCESKDEIRIQVGALVAEAGTDKAICTGSSVKLRGRGGSKYLWSPAAGLDDPNIADPTATPNQTTTYTLTVSDDLGTCSDEDEITIFVGDVESNFTVESPCSGDSAFFINQSIFIDGVPPTWEWDFGDQNNSDIKDPIHLYESPGTYNVTLKTTSGSCSNEVTKDVEIYPSPIANFVANPGIASTDNPSFQFYDKSTGGLTGTWYFGDGDSANYESGNSVIHTYSLLEQDKNSIYEYIVELKIENEFGCQDHVKYPVIIKALWTFYMPNSFTPNGDGINDQLFGIGNGFSDFNIIVYNKWGELVFKSNDITNGWNGNLKNGNKADQGVYIWKIEVKDLDGKKHQLYGHVSLLR